MENDENKIKLSEKISLTFRKKWLVNGSKTILIIAILFALYIALNLWVQTLELPEIDVTENKIYTLSDASKKAIEKVDKEITIYSYGFAEKSTLIDLLKQYTETNDKIKYEILTEESNYSMVQQYELKEGYFVLIFKSGEAEKVIDASSEFSSYDYTTYQSIDTTEQTITNSILALTEENKPKIYFVEGHKEYGAQEMTTFLAFLQNEAFEYETLNIATKGAIPEDCDILAIISPSTDLLEGETTAIKNYINKGGNIFFSMDVISEEPNFPNMQSVLDEYGVSIKNGYILEYAENMAVSNNPYIFMPEVSSTNKITADIYTDSREKMWLTFAGKLEYKDEETLNNLNIEKETLISSSDESAFIVDLKSDVSEAAKTAEIGKSEIGALLTKTMASGTETEEEKVTQSKLIVVASGSFISDYKVPALSSSYPLSYLGCNRDFAINSMAFLGDKNNTLTIRKDMANSTYLPTENENRIVITIIFIVPILIIIVGVIIGSYRRKRK